MKNFALAFFVFCLWALFGMWYYSCIIKGICNDHFSFFTAKPRVEVPVVDAQVQAQRRADSLARIEQKKQEALKAENNRIKNLFTSGDFKAQQVETGDTIYFFPSPVTIYKSRDNVYIPQPNRAFSSIISRYFDRNQQTELVIYGAYDPQTENLNNDSLGVARAQFLKNRLVRSGINPDRISTKAISKTLNFDNKGRNYEGLQLEFRNYTKERASQVEQGVSHKILYSGFAKENFRPDASLQNYAKELLVYLEKYPTKTVKVIGHTDNIGNDEDNKWVGMQRAKSVRRYLITQGVSEDRISALSKGESQPIVPNTSQVNRAKNRRIEIQVN